MVFWFFGFGFLDSTNLAITKWRKLPHSNNKSDDDIQGNNDPKTSQLVRVCKVSDLEQNKLHLFLVNNKDILLVKINEKIYATSGLCTHLPTKLDTGLLSGLEVTCALHLSKFNLSDGKALNLPAEENLKIYNVQIIDANVFITFDD